MEEEMMEMQQGQRPQMPDMAGANMSNGKPNTKEVSARAKQNMMKPSQELAAVLISRLTTMTPEQLDALDRAITPEAAKALIVLLPELGELMTAIDGGNAGRQEDPIGALGGMA
tara:strand:+ start:543 stop:884 length:342 start_codon:yes stop_codon:yes gene_type:complete